MRVSFHRVRHRASTLIAGRGQWQTHAVYLIRSQRNASPLGFLDIGDHPSSDPLTAITVEWSFRRCVSIAKRQRTCGPGSTRLSHRPSGRVAVIRTPDQRSSAESPFIERVRSILMTPRGVCLQCRSDVSVLDRHAITVDECHVSSPPI